MLLLSVVVVQDKAAVLSMLSGAVTLPSHSHRTDRFGRWDEWMRSATCALLACSRAFTFEWSSHAKNTLNLPMLDLQPDPMSEPEVGVRTLEFFELQLAFRQFFLLRPELTANVPP